MVWRTASAELRESLIILSDLVACMLALEVWLRTIKVWIIVLLCLWSGHSREKTSRMFDGVVLAQHVIKSLFFPETIVIA